MTNTTITQADETAASDQENWDENQHQVWNHRAGCYMSLDWVKRNDFIGSIVDFCQPKKDMKVLDVGTGPGVIAAALAPYVKDVIGMDMAEEMIHQARETHADLENVSFVMGDVQKMEYPSDTFDLVTGRMVFHHVGDCLAGFKEAMRVLKPGGMFLVCEGVPPDHLTRKRYEEIFALKEERHTFSEAEMINLFDRAGYQDILLRPFFMREVSLNNWLGGSGLPQSNIDEIRRLHIEADDHFKKIYNLFERDDDVLMDWKFIIVRGMKA